MFNKVKFELTKIEQDSFDKIKWIVTRDALLSYTYFNEEYNIHPDAFDFQLGSVIIQKGKTVTLYSSKFTYTHKRL